MCCVSVVEWSAIVGITAERAIRVSWSSTFLCLVFILYPGYTACGCLALVALRAYC